MTPFRQKVFAIVARIPKGKVSTYKEVARAAGRPRAVRAVGNILRTNRLLKKIPCYRVIKSDGRIGGYVLGIKEKAQKLRADGIRIRGDKIEKRFIWTFRP
jgi:O-6-methylguanine DNA methyltransferase